MPRHDRRYERRDEVPRISQTAQGVVFHPDPKRDKPWHVLFIDSMADTNPSSWLSDRKRGKRKAIGIPGGGQEVLISVKNVVGESKGEWMRYIDLEQRGYRVFRLDNNDTAGSTVIGRDSRLQKLALRYPFGYEFAAEAAVTNAFETAKLFITLMGEETLAGTLLREIYGETGLTVRIRPSRQFYGEDGNLSDAWIHKQAKRENGRIANFAYIFVCDVVSMDIASIEETDEVRGRIWFNLLESLPVQLHELRKKRPHCDALPFFSQILNVFNGFMNEGDMVSVSKPVRDAMAEDHPLKKAPYGTMAYLVINPERKRHRDASEHSLIHPSWLMALEYEGHLPMYHSDSGDKNEWERVLRWMRDKKKSSLSAEEKKALLEVFDRELKKDEIPTMASEAIETVVAASESVTDAADAKALSAMIEIASGASKYDSQGPFWEEEVLATEAEKARWRDEGADTEDIRLMIEHRAARAKKVTV